MFTILEVKLKPDDYEQLGTKEKFWCLDISETNPRKLSRYLFKYSRENTGEHWSEKIAEQLCEYLGIPHAKYELAQCAERFGVITPNLIESHCQMIMGNEALHGTYPDVYPPKPKDDEKRTRVKEHTINRVLDYLDNSKVCIPNSEFDLNGLNAGDLFCGYLLLDALVSNQDRHHENWAIIVNNKDQTKCLCPTYDHAACLGRELTDDSRNERLTSKDTNRQLATFVKKARSELFESSADKKTLTTVDAFYLSIATRAVAKQHWISKLNELTPDTFNHILNNIPIEVMTSTAKQFALEMLIENRKRVLNDERR
jgi:hypothetical protein